MIQCLDQELTLDEIAAKLSGVDLILSEGYKRAAKPAIEVVRAEGGLALIGEPGQLIAIACDVALEAAVPVFNLNEAAPLVDFIERNFLKNS